MNPCVDSACAELLAEKDARIALLTRERDDLRRRLDCALAATPPTEPEAPRWRAPSNLSESF